MIERLATWSRLDCQNILRALKYHAVIRLSLYDHPTGVPRPTDFPFGSVHLQHASDTCHEPAVVGAVRGS
jgi:hypothetical protein